jgi:hypothetical protein
VPETYSASSSISSTTVPFIKPATTTSTTSRAAH